MDKDSKTEEATPKRKGKLRGEGKVPRSQDLSSVAALIGATLALICYGASLLHGVIAFSRRAFRLEGSDAPLHAMGVFLPVLQESVMPVVFTSALVAAIVTGYQTDWLLTFSVLQPKPARINLLAGLKAVLPSKQSLIEIGKSFLKMVVMGAVTYLVLSQALPSLFMLATVEPLVAAFTVAGIAGRLVLYAIVAYLLLAIGDFKLAQRKFNEDAKMTKQEVADEKRSAQGDQQVKGKVRARMREVASRRAVSDVKHATVLVTNPTHISVALKYETDGESAPVVVSKGIDDVALRMRATARLHGIPIVENKPLARALHSTTNVGDLIPVELYAATAEVIAHVLKLRGAA